MNLFEVSEERKSAVDTVVDRIKELLIGRKLRPGDLIPSENVLAENLKVSRGSIREAMKILSAYGIVEVKRGSGTSISTKVNRKLFDPLLFEILVSDYDYTELVEVRDTMERGIIRQVIASATEEELAGLERVMESFDRVYEQDPEDLESNNRHDIMYHKLLAEITHNSLYINIYGFIIELFAPTINGTSGHEIHRNLHRAIMTRDEEDALRHLTEHTRFWSSHHR